METTELMTFGLQLDQLAAVFHCELPVSTKHAYWLALVDLPIEAIQFACVEVLKTETFMPVPAIIRLHALAFQRSYREEAARIEARQLRLTEARVQQEELQKLFASVWPNDTLKDPIPPYEEEAP